MKLKHRIAAVICSSLALGTSARADRTQWFHEARFGMFIHWGVYAVPAGEWRGEAIHATQAGPFPRRLSWGRVTRKASEHGGTTLYLHVWDWPADGRILLPTLQELPTSGKLLANGAAVTAERSADGVVVTLPGTATDPDASVARLDFPASITVTQQPFATPSADGSITLTAHDADPHGVVGGNIVVEGTGADAYLTGWTRPQYRVEYQLKTDTAGKWTAEAEIAAPEATRLTIGLAKSPATTEIPRTGPGTSWQTIKLGEIELPAGESTLELKPVRDAWKPVHLRKIRLVPISRLSPSAGDHE